MKFDQNIKRSNKALIILALCATTIIGCNVPSFMVTRTRVGTEDSVEGYEPFNKNNPDSSLAPIANERIETLHEEQQWKNANTADNIDAYEIFITKYPLSPYTKKAYLRLRELYEKEQVLQVKSNWEHAKEIDDIAAYEHFLVKNPSSPFIAEARKRLEEIGNDPLLDFMRNLWKSEMDQKAIAKTSSDKYHHRMVCLSTFSKDNTTRIVLKNKQHMFVEITENGINQLPIDYELLKLRFSKPYEACVIFISNKFTDGQELWEKLKPLILYMHDLIFSDMVIDAKESLIYLYPTHTFLIPEEADIIKSLGERFLQTAKIRIVPDIDLTLNVEDQKSIDYILCNTDANIRFIDALADLLNSNQDSIKVKAVEQLLFLNSSRGFEALRSAGEIAVGPLSKALSNEDKDIRERAELTHIRIGDPSEPVNAFSELKTIESYESFLEHYPESQYLSQVKNRIKRLSNERRKRQANAFAKIKKIYISKDVQLLDDRVDLPFTELEQQLVNSLDWKVTRNPEELVDAKLSISAFGSLDSNTYLYNIDSGCYERLWPGSDGIYEISPGVYSTVLSPGSVVAKYEFDTRLSLSIVIMINFGNSDIIARKYYITRSRIDDSNLFCEGDPAQYVFSLDDQKALFNQMFWSSTKLCDRDTGLVEGLIFLFEELGGIPVLERLAGGKERVEISARGKERVKGIAAFLLAEAKSKLAQ